MWSDDLLRAPRHWRREIEPSAEHGVYGLFLAPAASLGWLEPRRDGLIYIGKAEGGEGFAQRCHFAGRTLNHSPRKSLAVILRDHLNLELRAHPDGKWGLSRESDRLLSDWMTLNLQVAYLTSETAGALEKRLVLELAPPLNLNICEQGPQQRRIMQLRREAKATAHQGVVGEVSRYAEILHPERKPVLSSTRSSMPNIAASIEGAPQIARRYGLDPKSFRGALRKKKFAWHDLWGSWDVPRGSAEWQQMVAVAEDLSGLRLGDAS